MLFNFTLGQGCIYIIGGESEGRRPLGPSRSRRVDNIKMGPGEIEWSGMAWIDLAQDMNP
jgi:hypothetical protein